MSAIPNLVCADCGHEIDVDGAVGDVRFGMCENCGRSRRVRQIDRTLDLGADSETRSPKPCCKKIEPRRSVLHVSPTLEIPGGWCGRAEGHPGACAVVGVETSQATELVTCEECKTPNVAPKGNHLALHFRPGTVTPCRRSWPPAPPKKTAAT